MIINQVRYFKKTIRILQRILIFLLFSFTALIPEAAFAKSLIDSGNTLNNSDLSLDKYITYISETGDTLPGLAVRFKTTVKEIDDDNEFISSQETTLASGTAVKLPTKSVTSLESPYLIFPNSLFINGPAQVGFNTLAFVNSHPGWLREYVGFDGIGNRKGAEIVDNAAQAYSISPRLLLALLEYQSSALSEANPTEESLLFPMGYKNPRHQYLYNQVMWVAHQLNNGYYSWRDGSITSIIGKDGNILKPDPRENAASVAIQNFFFMIRPAYVFKYAISPEGFAATYNHLFGDAWASNKPHIPKNLKQPEFILPFDLGKTWAFTGGPHTAWGEDGQPWAALDFAPPSNLFGCETSEEWATAVAPGIVTRSEPGRVVLDLDSDGDERTGWVVSYFHIATKDRVLAGTRLNLGDHIGHPSCEGGHSTGSHVHISRQYNGEWVLAYGALAFVMDGWKAEKGEVEYKGTLVRDSQIVYANTNANSKSIVTREINSVLTEKEVANIIN